MGIKASVRYLESDVLTEAKARIKHVIDIFDHVYVAFSGGKDSLVTLHLVRECYREMGIVGPVRCLFRDEELIPSQVIDFVQAHWRDTENWSMDYYAVPLKSSKFILGQTYDYIQWDPAREWIRPKPASAITEIPGWENRVFSQYDMDAAAFSHLKGKVAIITGIRADESMTRFKAIVNKRHESHICSPDSAHPSNANLVRPIYDWSQNDIFKYLHDREIKYCDIYDSQVWNKENLRVSTPLHAESSKRIYKLRTRDPIFYEQLIALFPEMLMQERYWDEMDRGAIFEKYPPCFDGILQYIDENIEEARQAALAKRRVTEAFTTKRNGGANSPNFGGYPILHIFSQIVNGNYKRALMPLRDPSAADREYEARYLNFMKSRSKDRLSLTQQT